LIEKCCESAGIGLGQLDAVAVSAGPGSYTSLRVGASVAKGICYALGLPLIAVGTLEALALAAFQKEQDEEALYVPMLDARRMEVYCAVYNSQGETIEVAAPKVIDGASFHEYFSNNKKIIFCGPGSTKTRPILSSELAFFSLATCSAIHLQPISQVLFLQKKFENLAYFKPEYLKAPNITGPKLPPAA
jgi:tRNA threonylcarbamoyladenosine biosynthesis protein TsaB